MSMANVRKELESSPNVLNARMLHWSSIFAGTLMTLGFSLLFLLFGNSIGLNLTNTFSGTASGGLKTASWIYMFITLVAANFIGGYFSGRAAFDAHPYARALGWTHGLLTWALAGVIFYSVGSLSMNLVRLLVVGAASNSLNWLSFLVLALGCAASAMGGAFAPARRVGISATERERRVA